MGFVGTAAPDDPTEAPSKPVRAVVEDEAAAAEYRETLLMLAFSLSSDALWAAIAAADKAAVLADISAAC